MKSTTKFSLLTIFTLLLVACSKDYLQVDLQKNLTSDQFPVTPNDALLATNAAYTTLRLWDYNRGDYPIDDIMSDDARKGSNPSDEAAAIGVYDNFTFTASGACLNEWWCALYLGIKRANVVIDNVPAIQMDTVLRNRYVAEAKFLRAIFYMDLARAWGDVPLITTLNASATLGRDSVAKVYRLIDNDLQYAIDNLPLKSDYSNADAGRATKGAAQAFLAKSFLYQKDYTDAAKYALEVINSNQYALEDTFVNACGVNGNYGKESVFEIGSIAIENGDQGGNQYANTQGVRGVGNGQGPNRGWGFNRPSMDIRHTFEKEGDMIRLKGTIIDLGEVIDGDTIFGDQATPDVTLNGTDTVEVECYNRKVWVPGSDTKSEWACHRRLMRYAEVLLIASEALNETGDPGDALNYLNQVRSRVNLPARTVTDQTALRDTILLERRLELALEGHRFWDLVRTGDAAQVLGPLGFQTGKNELLPIPQTQMDISNKYFTQNKGW